MGTEYTPTHNIAHPDGQYAVDPESYLTALAQSVDSGLTSAIGTAAALASAPTYASGTNLDDITVGSIGNATASLVANTPSGATNGIVHTWVHPSNPENTRLQVYWELGLEGRVWTRFRGSTSWTDWRRIDAAAGRAASPRLASGTNLDDITTGQINAAFPAVDALLNAPTEVGGILYTYVNAVNSRLQMYYELGLSPRIWRRFRGSTAWTAWARVDAAYAIEQMSEMIGDGDGGGSPSALKTLPVVLSASTGSYSDDTVQAGGVRFPLNVNARITRWRLCIRNHNYRTGVNYTPGASFTGLWVGPRSGQTAAFDSAPTQISGPFTLAAGGDEYATPWSTHPIGDGAELLVSLGWTGATGPNTRSPAGCYRSTNSGTGGATSGAGYAVANSVPFSWHLEVETAATTPVVAIWGDSISCGTGNTFVIHDSPLSQYCRTIGAIPFHAGYPGTAMLQWEPAGNNYAAWSRFKHLARPDAVIHFMGQNDLITADQTEMRRRFEATLPLVREHLSQNVYVATITPHAGKTEAQNTIRKNYNTWLRTLPLGVRDVFEFGPAVANAANDALLPVYDSGDGLHLSTAGSTALADAVTRPVTTQRTDLDSDWVALSHPNVSSGSIQIRRVGNLVQLSLEAVTLVAGADLGGLIPDKFRPTIGTNPYVYGQTVGYFSSNAVRNVRVHYLGDLQISGAQADDVLQLDMTWVTDI